MTWTPGHEGILGNEAADAAAKLAATGPAASSRSRRLPRFLRRPLPLSSSALKQAHTAELKVTWSRMWRLSPRYRRYAHLGALLTPSQSRRLLLPMPRSQMSVITQLRTGHAPLNAHLARISKADSAACPRCAYRSETVRHFVLDCPEYHEERWALRTRMGRGGDRLSKLLYTKSGMKNLLRFVAQTGRLRTTHGKISTEG